MDVYLKRTRRIAKHTKATYCLIKEGDKYTIFAKSYNRKTNQRVKEIAYEFTQNEQKAREIFSKIYKSRTSVYHLLDVIYDLMWWNNEHILKKYHF